MKKKHARIKTKTFSSKNKKPKATSVLITQFHVNDEHYIRHKLKPNSKDLRKKYFFQKALGMNLTITKTLKNLNLLIIILNSTLLIKSSIWWVSNSCLKPSPTCTNWHP